MPNLLFYEEYHYRKGISRNFLLNISYIPSPLYSSDPGISYYCGARRFSLVRADKTFDFLAIDEDQRGIETVKLP